MQAKTCMTANTLYSVRREKSKCHESARTVKRIVHEGHQGITRSTKGCGIRQVQDIINKCQHNSSERKQRRSENSIAVLPLKIKPAAAGGRRGSSREATQQQQEDKRQEATGAGKSGGRSRGSRLPLCSSIDSIKVTGGGGIDPFVCTLQLINETRDKKDEDDDDEKDWTMTEGGLAPEVMACRRDGRREAH